MPGSILARRKHAALADTFVMTKAERSIIRMAIATHPALQDNPDLANAIAAANGFPVADPKQSLAAKATRR